MKFGKFKINDIIALIAGILSITIGIDRYILNELIYDNIPYNVTVPLWVILVLIIILIILFWYISKLVFNKEVILPVKTAENVTALYNTNDVAKYIGTLGQQDNSYYHPESIRQTHIMSGLVPPDLDIVQSYLKNLSHEERPEIERLIIVSRPVDIDFAAHSLELADHYGNDRMLVRIAYERIKSLPSYPNITLAFWKNNRLPEVLFSFPLIKHLRHPPKAGQTEDLTSGILVRGREIYNVSRRFFDSICRIVVNNQMDVSSKIVLDEARINLWKIQKHEYCRAIAISIAESMWCDSTINNRIEYIGLVGSALDNNRSPRDIDIVILFENDPTVDDYRNVQNHVQKICNRFSSKSVKFVPVWSANPVKIFMENYDGLISFPVHILLNTKDTMRKWSVFISWHRGKYHDDLIGNYPDALIPEKYTIKDLIEGIHGVRSLINSIKTECVEDMSWVERGNTMVREKRSIKIDSKESRIQFLKYAVEWVTRDLFWASDTPFSQDVQSDDLSRLGIVTSDFKFSESTKNELKKILNAEWDGDWNKGKNAVLEYLYSIENMV